MSSPSLSQAAVRPGGEKDRRIRERNRVKDIREVLLEIDPGRYAKLDKVEVIKEAGRVIAQLHRECQPAVRQCDSIDNHSMASNASISVPTCDSPCRRSKTPSPEALPKSQLEGAILSGLEKERKAGIWQPQF